MGTRSNAPHLLLLAGLVSAIGVVTCLAAVPKTSDNRLDRDPGAAIEALEIGPVRPAQQARPPATVAPPRGNPLWSVPFSALNGTRERPIFSASRRPPPRAILAPVVEQAAAPVPPKVALPEPSSMQLLGAVVGDKDAIAILLDQTTKEVVRLRVGEDRRGWTLGSVQNREATIRRKDQTEVLVLQRPDEARGPPAGSATLPVTRSSTDNSYAPFIPRSTPKNGESDGL
jgi:general secretion pathway protein N